jgi:hypothetical protein
VCLRALGADEATPSPVQLPDCSSRGSAGLQMRLHAIVRTDRAEEQGLFWSTERSQKPFIRMKVRWITWSQPGVDSTRLLHLMQSMPVQYHTGTHCCTTHSVRTQYASRMVSVCIRIPHCGGAHHGH